MTDDKPSSPGLEPAPDVKREPPPCPMCGDPSDPRFWYRDVQFCDGCWPDPKREDNPFGFIVVNRMLDALSERDRLRADLSDAARDLPISLPEPGTITAKLLSANVLLRRENEALTAERDRLATEVAALRAAIRDAAGAAEIGDGKHPMQPVVLDSHGVPRFKENKIVQWLLYEGTFDLNMIAIKVGSGQFSNEDQVQLAQLIGYSVGGFGELSYVPDDVYEAADKMAVEALSATETAPEAQGRRDGKATT